jgi:ribose-phosphate pyrophosphokinase
MTTALRTAVRIIAGNAHPALAESLSRELKVPLLTAKVGAFADGETRLRIAQDVRDADVFIVQPTARR